MVYGYIWIDQVMWKYILVFNSKLETLVVWVSFVHVGNWKSLEYLPGFIFCCISVTCILRWATYKNEPTCPQCKHPFLFLNLHRSLDGRYYLSPVLSPRSVYWKPLNHFFPHVCTTMWEFKMTRVNWIIYVWLWVEIKLLISWENIICSIND